MERLEGRRGGSLDGHHVSQKIEVREEIAWLPTGSERIKRERESSVKMSERFIHVERLGGRRGGWLDGHLVSQNGEVCEEVDWLPTGRERIKTGWKSSVKESERSIP